MSLVEIARYQDVYEADLAVAFLSSHGLDVDVTERFQTTVDPLMQRALGLRLMAPAHQADEAKALLEQVAAGDFAETDVEDDLPQRDGRTRAVGTVTALFLAATGGFAATSLPRRLRPAQIIGLRVIGALVLLSFVLWVLSLF